MLVNVAKSNISLYITMYTCILIFFMLTCLCYYLWSYSIYSIIYSRLIEHLYNNRVREKG